MENVVQKEPIKVMVVDDHTLVRQGFVNILNLCSEFKVVGEAEQSDQALELLNKVTPDVILMDLRIPGSEINGIEATAQVTKNFPGIKVIILSMWDREEDVLEAVKSGAVGYILKDVSKEDLFKAIKLVYKGEAYIQPQLAYKVIKKFAYLDELLKEKETSPVELSPRQLEVLKLVAEGLPNKSIASALNIGEKTVKTHLRLIFRKFDITSRSQAVAQAMKYNILKKARYL
jgi:two-component system response regulator DegU